MTNESAVEYQDSNGDGVPDAFEHRRPISEILSEGDSASTVPTAIIEVETTMRAPKKGEYFIYAGGIEQAHGNLSRDTKALILKRVIAGKI